MEVHTLVIARKIMQGVDLACKIMLLSLQLEGAAMDERAVTRTWLNRQLDESKARQEELRTAYDEARNKLDQDFEDAIRKEAARVEAVVNILRLEFGVVDRDAHIAPPKVHDLAGLTAADAACQVLSEAGSDMHVSDITHELISRGVSFSGATPQQSVYVALMRDNRVEKAGRGRFKLAGSATTGSQATVHRVGPVSGTESLLKEVGKPLHVKEILHLLLERGMVSGSRRPLAMLSGSLRKSSKFKLFGPETFGLAEW